MLAAVGARDAQAAHWQYQPNHELWCVGPGADELPAVYHHDGGAAGYCPPDPVTHEQAEAYAADWWRAQCESEKRFNLPGNPPTACDHVRRQPDAGEAQRTAEQADLLAASRAARIQGIEAYCTLTKFSALLRKDRWNS